MKTIFSAAVLNRYRAKGKRYNIVKGHTGTDKDFNYEPIPTPVKGEIVAITHQVEMGDCLYIRDTWGNIHVFAHLDSIKVKLHDIVARGDIVAISGNTGSATSGPHLHYEIITKTPWTDPVKGGSWVNRIMSRFLAGFSGYNVDPMEYLKYLYHYFGIKI